MSDPCKEWVVGGSGLAHSGRPLTDGIILGRNLCFLGPNLIDLDISRTTYYAGTYIKYTALTDAGVSVFRRSP